MSIVSVSLSHHHHRTFFFYEKKYKLCTLTAASYRVNIVFMFHKCSGAINGATADDVTYRRSLKLYHFYTYQFYLSVLSDFFLIIEKPTKTKSTIAKKQKKNH